jgi:hypothetical protein
MKGRTQAEGVNRDELRVDWIKFHREELRDLTVHQMLLGRSNEEE